MTTPLDLTGIALKLKEANGDQAEAANGDVLGKLQEKLGKLLEKLDKLLAALEPRSYKGESVRVFSGQSVDALSDKVVDVWGYNAVCVLVLVSGTTPSAVFSIEGATSAGGVYVLLPSTTQAAITANAAFNATVGAEFIKVRLASISGTFGSGQGFIVIVIPYIA